MILFARFVLSARRHAGAAFVLLIAFAALAVFFIRVTPAHSQPSGAGGDVSPALIERGAYLAKLGDCAGCHTAAPARNGGKKTDPFAGGLPMGSPFGTIWTSNITPDPIYGIGRYSYGDFERAVREGVAPGGKRLYPAMPYPSFAKISDDDMHALYAYFMHGVKPVARPAPKTDLPFPFNQRWALVFWDEFFASHERFSPREDRGVQWNRGAYLVQGLGHCGACHTPRGPAYQERGLSDGDPLYLTGGTLDHWFAPNLTGDPGSGLGRFSADDIAQFLRYGHGGGLAAFGSMVEVIEDSGQYMSDADRHAIAAYLKTLPPRAKSGQANSDQEKSDRTVDVLRTGAIEVPGAGIYSAFCARCHKEDGRGEAGKYPRLAGNPTVIAPETTSLMRLLMEGGRAAQTDGGPKPERMPSFAGKLTDTEMARVLTFVRSAWGNEAEPVTPREVRVLRHVLHK
ncbi:cytochrome c [Trinickia sp. EG282A]|uniref:cytochrome c n=1 Tax=Trinickia sp. EG282A TaxID=3237013 RepID=UPI0034D256B7